MHIDNLLRIGAVHVAMSIIDVTIEPTIGPLNALNNILLRQRFEILIDRGVANVAALLAQAVVNLAGRQVLLRLPKQLENVAPLATQAHA